MRRLTQKDHSLHFMLADLSLFPHSRDLLTCLSSSIVFILLQECESLLHYSLQTRFTQNKGQGSHGESQDFPFSGSGMLQVYS